MVVDDDDHRIDTSIKNEIVQQIISLILWIENDSRILNVDNKTLASLKTKIMEPNLGS